MAKCQIKKRGKIHQDEDVTCWVNIGPAETILPKKWPRNRRYFDGTCKSENPPLPFWKKQEKTFLLIPHYYTPVVTGHFTPVLIYFQNLGGMSGMIIIEDDPKTMSPELDAASCPNNCDNDIPMVFQLFQYRSDEDGSFSVAQKDIHDDDMFRYVEENWSWKNVEKWLLG